MNVDWKKVAGLLFCADNSDLTYVNPENNRDELGDLMPSTNTFLQGQEGTVTVSASIIDANNNIATGNQVVPEASYVDKSQNVQLLPRFMGNTFLTVPLFFGGFSGPVLAPAILQSPKVDIWTSELEYSGLDI